MDYTNRKYPFGIDFSNVSPIPDNPAGLLKYKTDFKELIKTEQKKIKLFHRSGAGGREVIQAHTSLIDSVLCHLIKELAAFRKKMSPKALLEEFSLNHIRNSKAFTLSGGERRRTEIARALATNPKFILLDEPFAGVDPIAVEDIQQIVATLKDKNIGILVTDHNVHETLKITDRAYLLFEGNILKQGTAEELADDEQVRKVYLGKNFEL